MVVKPFLSPYQTKNSKSKTKGNSLENSIYRSIDHILSNNKNQAEIKKEFPDPSLKRRNTGYALDLLLNLQPFNSDGNRFNFSNLLAGSEGTLAFTTAIKTKTWFHSHLPIQLLFVFILKALKMH